jgi:hypothetical protein
MADRGSRGFPFETPYAEIRRLRAENARLRQLLSAHGIPIPPLGLEDCPAEVLPSSSARLRPDVQEEKSLLRGASPMLNRSASIAVFALDISFAARSARRGYCVAWTNRTTGARRLPAAS